MSRLTKSQLQRMAERQTTALTEDERVVYAYLTAKVHHGIDGLKMDAFKELYEPAADLLYMQVKTYQ